MRSLNTFYPVSAKEQLTPKWLGKPGEKNTAVVKTLQVQAEFLKETGQINALPKDMNGLDRHQLRRADGLMGRAGSPGRRGQGALRRGHQALRQRRRLGAGAGADDARHRRKRLRLPGRPVGLRQEHAAQHPGRLRDADQRRGADGRRAGARPRSAARRGVPAGRAVHLDERCRTTSPSVRWPPASRPAEARAHRGPLPRDGGPDRLRASATRTSCPAACSSAWASRARWPTTRRCC